MKLAKEFESVTGSPQWKIGEAELKWELMEWKQKYIELKMEEMEERFEEERRRADERMKEIDDKQRLAEKCYELMREKEMMLDEKLEKFRLKEERQDEKEAMVSRKQLSSGTSEKESAKEFDEFQLKDKSIEKGLGEKMLDIELNKEQLKSKSSNMKDNDIPLHLLESIKAKGEVTVDAVHPLQQCDLINFIIEEKIDVSLTSPGEIFSFEVKGRLSVRSLEMKDAYIQVQVESGRNPGTTFTTHPKINEALFASENILGPKDSCESFPTSQSEDGADLLSWRGFIEDESSLPMKISCCPSLSANEACIRVEYEASSMFELQNVVISVPLPTLQEVPNIKQIDGDWRYNFRENILEWSILSINSSNRSGSMEFVVPPVKYTTQFHPILIRFTAANTRSCSGLKVVNVMPMKPVPTPKYTQRVLLQIENYELW